MGCASSQEDSSSNGNNTAIKLREYAGRSYWVNVYSSQLISLQKHQKNVLQLSNSFAQVLTIPIQHTTTTTTTATTAANSAPNATNIIQPVAAAAASSSSSSSSSTPSSSSSSSSSTDKSSKADTSKEASKLINTFSESVDASYDKLFLQDKKKQRKQLEQLWILYCGSITNEMTSDNLQDILYDSLSALLPEDAEIKLQEQVDIMTRQKEKLIISSSTTALAATTTTNTNTNTNTTTTTTTTAPTTATAPTAPTANTTTTTTATIAAAAATTTLTPDAVEEAQSITSTATSPTAPRLSPLSPSSPSSASSASSPTPSSPSPSSVASIELSTLYTPPDVLAPYLHTPNTSLLYQYIEVCLDETKKFVIEQRCKKLNRSHLPATELTLIDRLISNEKKSLYASMVYWVVTFRVLHKEVTRQIMLKMQLNKAAAHAEGGGAEAAVGGEAVGADFVTKETFITHFIEAAKDIMGMNFYENMEKENA